MFHLILKKVDSTTFYLKLDFFKSNFVPINPIRENAAIIILTKIPSDVFGTEVSLYPNV